MDKMETIWIVLGVIAILVVVLYRPREAMTNKDLLDTLKTFGEKGTPSSKKSANPAIYGPKTTKAEEPAPSASSKNHEDDRNTYPDIYGPDVSLVPGGKQCKKGVHESDCSEPEFNPDFSHAFPRADGEPQPFLTDFSKFQH